MGDNKQQHDTDTLHQLAIQAQQGNQQALERILIYAKVKRIIYSIAHKMVGQTNADDIYQEVCLRIVKSIHAWQGTTAITNWISSITANQCKTFLIRQKQENEQRRHLTVIVNPPSYDELEQFTQAWLQERRRLIKDVLADMGEQCAEIMTLYLFEHLDRKEIMQRVCLKKSRFYKAWGQCADELRERLQKKLHNQRKNSKVQQSYSK